MQGERFSCKTTVSTDHSKGRCLLFMDDVIQQIENTMVYVRKIDRGEDLAHPWVSTFKMVLDLRKFLENLNDDISTTPNPDFREDEVLAEYVYEMLSFARSNMYVFRSRAQGRDDNVYHSHDAKDFANSSAQTLDNIAMVLRNHVQHAL